MAELVFPDIDNPQNKKSLMSSFVNTGRVFFFLSIQEAKFILNIYFIAKLLVKISVTFTNFFVIDDTKDTIFIPQLQ